MANKIDDESVEYQSISRYNQLVLTSFRIDAYNKILRNCAVELFNISQSIGSLEYEKTLLIERKEVVEKKIKELEELLEKYNDLKE
jgi:cob(I)alamin adenosyltransferase